MTNLQQKVFEDHANGRCTTQDLIDEQERNTLSFSEFLDAYQKRVEELKEEVATAEEVQVQYHGVLERVWQCGTAHWPDKLFDDVKKLLNNGSL